VDLENVLFVEINRHTPDIHCSLETGELWPRIVAGTHE